MIQQKLAFMEANLSCIAKIAPEENPSTFFTAEKSRCSTEFLNVDHYNY